MPSVAAEANRLFARSFGAPVRSPVGNLAVSHMPHHRPNARVLALLAGFGAVWLAGAPIHAEELRVFGDGSNANNADLGVPVPTDCGADRLCPDVAGAATAEVGDAFFTPSFALTLRGAYQHDGTSGQPLFEMLPSASFSHAGRRANLTLDADATIEGPENGTGRLSGLNFGAEGDYQLDRDMRLSASGGLTFSQDSLNDFGVDATVAQMPINLSGSVDGTLERRFGRLGVSVMAGAARSQWTDTVLVDTSHVDNAERNETSANLGLRGSYELTPILAAFAQVDGTRLVYDAPSSGLGVKLDGYSLAARVGLAANWRDVLTGEASLGYGVRTFDDAGLSRWAPGWPMPA